MIQELKTHKLLFGLVLFISLGLALQKVFSLSVGRFSDANAVLRAQPGLLISDTGGLLSEADSIRIFRRLDTPLVRIHYVRTHEWIEKIAHELGVWPVSIRSTNNLEDPLLRVHQPILVQNKNGIMHVAQEGESLEAVIKTYEKLGAKRESILAANNLDEITYFKDGELCLIEGSDVWIPGARRSYPFFMRPVHWLRISSGFGMRYHPLLHIRRRHDGFDLVAPYGSPVYAADAGVITYAGWMGGYGNMIEIHRGRFRTRYGHLSKINVTVGQHVRRHQVIGRVGSTGISTGPHLHFEVRVNGRPVSPGRYLF